MTAIQIICEKDSGVVKGFEISGHAGFGRRGKDIACASVSILAINTQNSIEKYCEDEFEQWLEEKSGYMKFLIKDTPSHDASILLASAYMGFEEIANQYAKFVTLNIKEV